MTLITRKATSVRRNICVKSSLKVKSLYDKKKGYISGRDLRKTRSDPMTSEIFSRYCFKLPNAIMYKKRQMLVFPPFVESACFLRATGKQ